MIQFFNEQFCKSFGQIFYSALFILPSVKLGAIPKEFIENSLIKSEIIPDAYTAPPDYGIEIWFNHVQVEYGNHILITDLKEEPNHVNWVHMKGDRFTLIMSGLDVPSSDDPKEREALYWMVGNIRETDIGGGEVWASYEPPWPLGGVGPHRIMFTIYKHIRGRRINYKDKIIKKRHPREDRLNFSTRVFGEKFKLKAPYAANFFDLFDNSSYPVLD